MGILKRGDSQKCLIVGKSGKELEFKNLSRKGNVLEETLNDRKYVVADPPVDLKEGIKKRSPIYLVDKEKGSTVSISKSQELIELKTDPDLISSVLQGTLLEQAFSLKPETKTIIVALIVGFVVGLMF